MSTFGKYFRVTTWGESHAPSVGVVIDSPCPGMWLCPHDIQPALDRRRPGQSVVTTARAEHDEVRIMAGVEQGRCLGTPVCLMVHNKDMRPGDYAALSSIPRPGHADYTYQVKYGVRAASGGGRSSARETIGRVAAGAVAAKWLGEGWGTDVTAFVSAVGDVKLPASLERAPDGQPWTALQVEERGTLVLLRWPYEQAQHAGAKRGRAVACPEQAPSLDAAMLAGVAGGVPVFFSEYTQRLYDVAGTEVARAGDLWPPSLAPPAGVPAPCPALGEWNNTGQVLHLRCPDGPTAAAMAGKILQAKAQHDSIGGVVTCVGTRVPAGLGEPVFDKLPALLAHGMLSLPAVKGFEMGDGFASAGLRGSEHNDPFMPACAAATPASAASQPGASWVQARPGPCPDCFAGAASACRSSSERGAVLLRPQTNHAGGTLGGITSGADLVFRVAIKPVSTIGSQQSTATDTGSQAVLAAKGRHDSCVLPRATPLVEAMAWLVLADCMCAQQARMGASSGVAADGRALQGPACPVLERPAPGE